MKNLILKPSPNFSLFNKADSKFNINFPDFSEKQYKFIFSTKRFTLYSGGRGSGKTFTGAWRSLVLALLMPGLHFAGCFTYRMLKDFMLLELLKALSKFPKNKWQLRKSDMELDFFESTIRLRQLDDEGKARGSEYRTEWIDEWTVGILKSTFESIVGSMRLGNKQFFSGTCNPGSKSHYIYDFFYNPPIKSAKDRLWFEVSTKDNEINLPKDYTDDLLSRPEAWKRRFYYGKWGTMEGQVYKEFDRSLHVSEFNFNVDWETFLFTDFGFTHSFVTLLCARDSLDRWFVIYEYYKTQKRISFHIDYIKKYFMGFRPKLLIGDYEARDSLAEMEYELNIPVRYPIKAVEAGIDTVRSYMEIRNGTVGLQIHKRCRSLIREFESYVFETTHSGEEIKEAPKKKDDDGMDALRYGLHTLK